jgi:diguanylate cyclase (GGDEF)-like protein
MKLPPVIKDRWERFSRRVAEAGEPYRFHVSLFWQALSMRAKLSVLFAFLILAMTGFFYGFAVYQTSREIKLSAIYKGEAVAEALKGEAAYALQTQNFPNLNFTFRRLASSRNDISYVFLVDTEGQVLAHSEPEAVGQVLTDPITRQSLGAVATQVQFERVAVAGEQDYVDLCDLSVPILFKGKRAATLRIGISLTQYLLANGPRIRRNVLLFTLPFALLSILIAIKLSDSFTRPLKRMAKAVSEVSGGNYNVQLPLNRRDELGEVAHAFNVMAVHLRENFEKVLNMANHDGLTGLYNARFFHETLSREMELARRTGRAISLIIFDADRFKRINDRYGHPLGDQILQHISRVAHSVLRGYDLLARYGGEEFIAMLTDTTGMQAMNLAERLRKVLEQRPFITEDGDVIKVTVSIGVAQAFPPYDKKDVIAHADRALYRAKEGGRNRAILYGHSTEHLPGSEQQIQQS